MSSGVDLHFEAWKKYDRFAEDGSQPNQRFRVTIYRLIARVYLNKLFLRPLEEYGNEASFKLESVFMANVKNYSRYISMKRLGCCRSDRTLLFDFFLQ